MMKKFTFICVVFLIFIHAFLMAQKPYRGAEYRTIQTHQYGRFEVRMKSAAGSGVVSSFFTIRDYWADGLSSTENWREIDFEALGNYTDKFQTNIISAYESHHEDLHTLLYNPHTGFHTYAFEWTPSYIKFFIDDQLIRSDNGNYIGTFQEGQKIMMNIWQPIWVDWVGEFDESILPIYAFYDWVKYYAYTPGNGNYGSDSNFSYDWSDDLDFFDNSRWQKASHTWDSNNAQFVQQNAVIQDGFLILCLTDNITSGYSGDPLSSVEDIDMPISKNLKVYPNPFNSSLFINVPVQINNQIKKFSLFDLNGRAIISINDKTLLKDKINISFKNKNLSSGIYYCQVSTLSKSYNFKVTYIR